MKILRLPSCSARGCLLFILCCNSLILSYIYIPQRLFPTHPLKLLFPSPTLKRRFPSPTNSTTTPTSRLLPAGYWRHRREHPEAYKSPSCARVPEAEDIEYAAAFWQHLRLENGSMYMYSAYWDGRFEEPLVRVLVYTDVGAVPKLFCQLWFLNETAPHIVAAQATYAWHSEWLGPTAGVNEPYILTCNPTFHHHNPYRHAAPPAAVSIVTRPCEKATNVLNVQNTPSSTHPTSNSSPSSVAVCLRCVDYNEDISAQILEWLLLLKYFKTETVYIYLVRAHDNVLRVLNHFASIGFVRLTELTHPPWLESPGGVLQWSWRQRNILDYRRELLSLNDCLYRSVGRHGWLTNLDIDEIIVPVRDHTYPELLSHLLYSSIDALAFRNVYYLDVAQKDHKAPPFAKKLAHTWRARQTSDYGRHVKSFNNVQTIVAIHNHLPVVCRTDCQYRYYPPAFARLQHYRANCFDLEGAEACKNATEDVFREATLEPWRRRLLEDIPQILNALGIPVPVGGKGRPEDS